MIDFSQSTEWHNLQFEALKETCLGCTRCRLSETRTQVVFGSGDPKSPIMLIGEGPGEQEDLSGVPFVGRAGQLLTQILNSVGISRDRDVYITNTVKCRPPQNRDPLADEISGCQGYLIRQLQLIQPRILLLVGNPALKSVMGPEHSISKVRGTWHKMTVTYMEHPLYVMPLFHPSFLLRNASKEPGSPKWLTWQDVKEVKAALDICRMEMNEGHVNIEAQ